MRGAVAGGVGMIVGTAVGAGGLLLLEVVALAAALAFFQADATTPERVEVAQVKGRSGEVQLFTMAATTPLVDGSPLAWDGMSYTADLTAGTHRLQLIDGLGRQSGVYDFEVVAGQRTQLRWAKKVVEDLGRVPMSGARGGTAPAVASAPEHAETPAITASLSEERVEASVSATKGGINVSLPKLGRRLAR